MPVKTQNEGAAPGKMVEISRTFGAPRSRVFEAWTTAGSLERWFAPDGCSLRVKAMEFKPGGVLHTCIRTPVGDCWCIGYYKEIVPNEKIVFTMAFSDEAGNRVENPAVGKDPEWPRETTVTVRFSEAGGKTTLSLHQTALEKVAMRTGALPSWLKMLDRLEKEVAG